MSINNEDLSCHGKQEFFVDAPAGITVKGLQEFLKLGDRPLVTVVNGVVEKKDFTISDRDRGGIFPPIAGVVQGGRFSAFESEYHSVSRRFFSIW